MPFRPEFLALTRQQYGAEMRLLDFAQAEAASREINRWVEQQTNGKIKDLIPPGSLDALTRLVLTNAVYFKGDWVQPFDKQNTREEDFAVSARAKVKTPLMHLKSKTGLRRGGNVPGAGASLRGRGTLDGRALAEESGRAAGVGEGDHGRQARRADGEAPRREVDAYLPKFKLETSFGLKPTLEAMGMKRAFSRDADFSGISSTEPLYISAVLHKAYVDVNEEGTEAAAATGVVVGAMAARVPQPVPVFRADHPFLFVIRDTQAGSILFMGRLTKPSK